MCCQHIREEEQAELGYQEKSFPAPQEGTAYSRSCLQTNCSGEPEWLLPENIDQASYGPVY